jgi:hypothetical protein
MDMMFSDAVLSKILDQSVVYQCACPAQVCRMLFQQRELFAYQRDCLDLSEVDRAVHLRIAQALRASHQMMEDCLTEILRLEGWDQDSYEMPEALKARLRQSMDCA